LFSSTAATPALRREKAMAIDLEAAVMRKAA
jgi:hypothetical protein